MASFKRLPVELITAVVNFLDDVNDVVSCSLVNRLLYDISDPILYKKAGRYRLDCVLFWAATLGRTATLEKALRAGAKANALLLTEYNGDEVRRRGPRFYLENHEYDVLSTAVVRPDGLPFSLYAYYRWTPLHVAASLGHEKIVDVLLQHGASIEAGSTNFCSCSNKFITYTRSGIAITRPSWSPLHTASCFKQDSTAQLLLSKGASIFTERSIEDEDQRWTALHDACRSGSLVMTQFLIENKHVAEIDRLDEQNLSALCYAYHGGNWGCFTFLLEKGADINCFFGQPRDQDDHFSILDDACETRRLSDALTLIEKGIDVKKSVTRESTPLHRCLTVRAYDVRTTSLENDAERIKLLERILACGVDVNAKDDESRTPLHLAVKTGSKDVVNLLLDRGADIEAEDWNQQTPLRAACYRESPSAAMMKLLFERGATVPRADDLLESLCAFPKFRTDKLGCISLLLEHTMGGHDDKIPSSMFSESLVQLCLSSGDGAVLDKILEFYAPPCMASDKHHLLYYFSIVLRRPNGRCFQFLLDLDSRGHLVKRKESLWQILDEVQDKELDKMGELLLSRGAECGRRGLTREAALRRALHRASYRSYTRIMKCLLERGADPNGPVGTSRPLHETLRYGTENEALQILLQAGADIYLTNGKPDSGYPLKAAITRNIPEKFEIMWNNDSAKDDIHDGILFDMVETCCVYGRFKILQMVQSRFESKVNHIMSDKFIAFLQGLLHNLDNHSYWRTTDDMDQAIDVMSLLQRHDSENKAFTADWQWKDNYMAADNALGALEMILECDVDEDDKQWNSRSWCIGERVTVEYADEDLQHADISISQERIVFQNGIQDTTRTPVDLEYLAIPANFTPTESFDDDSEMGFFMGDEPDWDDDDEDFMWDLMDEFGEMDEMDDFDDNMWAPF